MTTVELLESEVADAVHTRGEQLAMAGRDTGALSHQPSCELRRDSGAEKLRCCNGSAGFASDAVHDCELGIDLFLAALALSISP